MRRTLLLITLPLLAIGPAACKPSPVAAPATSPQAGSFEADTAGRTITCPATTEAGGWTWSAVLTQGYGLVIKDLRYGPRLVARTYGATYVKPKGFGAGTGHLTVAPRVTDADLRSTLVGEPVCDPGRSAVSAVYRLRSESTGHSFLVRQAYRFDPYNPQEKCEPTGTARCVRFWPTVTWALEGARTVGPDNRDVGLAVVQRFDFDPDGMGSGTSNIIRDVPDKANWFKVDHLGEHMLTREDAIIAIDKGRTAKWENWHQTGREHLGLPGTPKFTYFGSGHAGCSECVHYHWSWFGGSDLFGRIGNTLGSWCRSDGCWSDGEPQILDGSRQKACIGWLQASSAGTEEDADWCARAGSWQGGTADGSSPMVMYWQSETTGFTAPGSGVTVDGRHSRIGDASFPQLPGGLNDWQHGGNGSMFLVPARRFRAAAEATEKNEAVLTPMAGAPFDGTGTRLPSGYLVPVALTLGDKEDEGPYYLRVRSHGPVVRNAEGPADPATGDRWVRVYNELAPAGSAPPVLQPAGDPPALHYSRDLPAVAYVVLDRAPRTPEEVTYELQAAPDGIPGYLAAGRTDFDGNTGWQIGRNGLMFRQDEWEIQLSWLRWADGGVRADVRYINIGTTTRSLPCPDASGGSALVFASETVPMSDGPCASAIGKVTPVEPGTSFKSWGFFPTTGHRGEMFAMRWWDFGTTPPIFLMPS